MTWLLFAALGITGNAFVVTLIMLWKTAVRLPGSVGFVRKKVTETMVMCAAIAAGGSLLPGF
jgi:hypothetical protein